MYLTALREGFMEVPGSTLQSLAQARDRLDAWTDAKIRQELQAVDPASFQAIHPNDRYRGQRALEVHLISGQTFTQLKAAHQPSACLGLQYPTFVLERPVDELDRRIALRTDLMLENGWLEETEQALTIYPAQCPGLLSIGYREIVQVLQGMGDRSTLGSSIFRVTRQYAKRQRTWFRHISAECSLHPEDNHLPNMILKAIGE